MKLMFMLQTKFYIKDKNSFHTLWTKIFEMKFGLLLL